MATVDKTEDYEFVALPEEPTIKIIEDYEILTLSGHEYESLGECPDNTIRLLDLLPGQAGSPIRCHLWNGTIKDKFTALSYVWGSGIATKEIKIRWHDRYANHYVRESLFDCLLHIRDIMGPCTLWVDAICVNQDDLTERGSQVKLMDQIFGKAERVVAWLGTTHDSAFKIHVKEQYLDCFQWSHPKISHTSGGDTYSALNEEFYTDAMYAVLDICGRDYWKRMWIVQEVILASNLTLLWGQHTIAWELFATWCDTLSSANNAVDKQLKNWEIRKKCKAAIAESRVLEVAKDRAMRFGTREIYPQLSTLMLTYGGRRCSDPRDRIISLLSLAAQPTTGQRLKVENMYKMSARVLFSHVADVYGFDTASRSQLIWLIPPWNKEIKSLIDVT